MTIFQQARTSHPRATQRLQNRRHRCNHTALRSSPPDYISDFGCWAERTAQNVCLDELSNALGRIAVTKPLWGVTQLQDQYVRCPWLDMPARLSTTVTMLPAGESTWRAQVLTIIVDEGTRVVLGHALEEATHSEVVLTLGRGDLDDEPSVQEVDHA